VVWHTLMAMNPAADSAGRPARILVVEDDDNVRWLVAAYLEKEGYEILQSGDGPGGLATAQHEQPDLLILDVMLPGLSGLEIAQKVKSSRDVPILMLTSKDEEQDILAGFESGADDYLAKPFSPKVLVARVRAILHRAGVATGGQVTDRLACGDLALDTKTRFVKVGDQEVELTSTEFDLLRVLMEHPGWVYTREQLLEATTGYSHLGDSRAIDAHVANLRKKIEDDPADPKRLTTVRGVGYRLQAG
jgi:DNA-binding response OmpR family regulator